jgi:hypothetical protein
MYKAHMHQVHFFVASFEPRRAVEVGVPATQLLQAEHKIAIKGSIDIITPVDP